MAYQYNNNGSQSTSDKAIGKFGRNGHLVGWSFQPTKCPLLNPERFSAYQMSITPISKSSAVPLETFLSLYSTALNVALDFRMVAIMLLSFNGSKEDIANIILKDVGRTAVLRLGNHDKGLVAMSLQR